MQDQSTVAICQWDFLKVAALKWRPALFVELSLQRLLQAKFSRDLPKALLIFLVRPSL